MVRLLYCLRRREGLAAAEFREHWLGHHVPRYGEPIAAIRRYVLYPAIDETQAYDGVASVWFDDVASLAATMDGAMPAAAKDEARFIDHDHSRAFLVEDRVLLEPEGPAPIVLFECVARPPGAGREEFAAEWARRGEERAARARSTGLVAGHVQSLVRDGEDATRQFDRLGDQPDAYDGVATTYFGSVLLAREYLAQAGGTMADSGRNVSFLTRRHPRRAPRL